jgi:hypothetical protein
MPRERHDKHVQRPDLRFEQVSDLVLVAPKDQRADRAAALPDSSP